MVARPLAFPLLAVTLLVVPGAVAQSGGTGAPIGDVVSIDGRKVIPAPGVAVTELLFVARWCGPCAGELESARHRAATLRRRGFRLVPVGVAARESAGDFSAWAREHGAGGPLVYDSDGRLERAFGVDALPYHVLVDSRGRVLYKGSAPPSRERLDGLLGREGGPSTGRR